MSIDQFAQTVASFAFAIIVAIVPFILKAIYLQSVAWLAAKAHDAQWSVVIQAAAAVVAQVEQLRKAGALPSNEAALRWATQALGGWLISRGIDLPMSDLVTAIESAVHDLPHAARV